MSTVMSVHPLVREFGAAVRMIFPPVDSVLSTHVAVNAGLRSGSTVTCGLERKVCASGG